jgi:hypothetical protein
MADTNAASKRIDAVVQSALFKVISGGPAVLMAGILVWGFNRLDAGIAELTKNVASMQTELARQAVRLDYLERERGAHPKTGVSP